jgi:hypothetical protein
MHAPNVHSRLDVVDTGLLAAERKELSELTDDLLAVPLST